MQWIIDECVYLTGLKDVMESKKEECLNRFHEVFKDYDEVTGLGVMITLLIDISIHKGYNKNQFIYVMSTMYDRMVAAKKTIKQKENPKKSLWSIITSYFGS